MSNFSVMTEGTGPVIKHGSRIHLIYRMKDIKTEEVVAQSTSNHTEFDVID